MDYSSDNGLKGESMIGQTAVYSMPYEDTMYPHRPESTTQDTESQDIYKVIAEDLSVAKEHNQYTKEHNQHTVETTYDKADVTNIFPKKIPISPATRYSFSVLQEWEGYVVSISERTFTARLTDVTRDSKIEEEEADFPLDDLDDNDRSRLTTGAIFRWVIGYRRNSGGTKDRSSRIVFRNLPAWTTKEILKNQQDATEWASQLLVE
jgi:hypothetical protein